MPRRRQTPAPAPADVAITHPDKELFPGDGITKGDLAAYYAAIAPLMLPHIRGRPITMERYPSGLGRKGFIQKNLPSSAPAWLPHADVDKKGGTVRHALANDLRALMWIVNQNTITPHVWTSRAPALLRPDVCVFDLDPATDDEPEALRDAALRLRGVLQELGRESWVKTSGSKGFHIVVPMTGPRRKGDTARFAARVARQLVAGDPAHLTLEFSKADRAGRIYIDTARNGYGATFAAVYAVRAKPGAPVSAPCTWDEVASGRVQPRTFTLKAMAARVAAVGDLWSELP